jgi:hypothetical protein
MLATSILTYFITCHFGLCKKGETNTDGTRNPTTICMDYSSETPPSLTSGLVKSMVTKYNNTQLDYIQNAPGSQVPKDAQSIWFDLETLKKFLYHVENNANQHFNEFQNKKLGIRIYYAAYPKNEEMRVFAQSQTDPDFSYNPDYQFLHTLVMMPTISAADGNNYDFNPLDVATYDGFIKMPTKDKVAYDNGSYPTLTFGPGSYSNSTTVSQSQNIVRNHGILCPPGNTNGISF